MKRYEWYSELRPEQINARLLVRARPMKPGWMYEERQVFVKLLPDGRFYLMKTGGPWQVRPQLPFVGRVEPSGEGSLIAGDFSPTKGMSVQVAVMAGVVFLAALAFTWSAVVALAAALLSGGMWWGLLKVFGPSFSADQNRETLDFIEENLLREWRCGLWRERIRFKAPCRRIRFLAFCPESGKPAVSHQKWRSLSRPSGETNVLP